MPRNNKLIALCFFLRDYASKQYSVRLYVLTESYITDLSDFIRALLMSEKIQPIILFTPPLSLYQINMTPLTLATIFIRLFDISSN